MPISAGTHTIEFKFTTAGYPLAIFATIGGLLLFAAAIVLYVKFFRGRTTDDEPDLPQIPRYTDTETKQSERVIPTITATLPPPELPDEDEDEDESELLDIYTPKDDGGRWI